MADNVRYTNAQPAGTTPAPLAPAAFAPLGGLGVLASLPLPEPGTVVCL